MLSAMMTLDEQIGTLQAFKEGKALQHRVRGLFFEWTDVKGEALADLAIRGFNFVEYDFRVKAKGSSSAPLFRSTREYLRSP